MTREEISAQLATQEHRDGALELKARYKTRSELLTAIKEGVDQHPTLVLFRELHAHLAREALNEQRASS